MKAPRLVEEFNISYLVIKNIYEKFTNEGLLSHAQVAIEDSPVGVNTIWNLSSDYGSIIGDILVDDIHWAVQSRPANTSLPWDVTVFGKVLNYWKNVNGLNLAFLMPTFNV